MIEVKNLCHDIGGKIILKNVNLTLQEGSVMGLVGINGAGKTTLLRLISGVLTPKLGEILIDGQSVGEEEARRALFFLPDDPYYTIYTTGESLYKSKLVPPGKAITEITMSKALSAGQYEATIKITTTSLEDGSAMNGANVETVLNVK